MIDPFLSAGDPDFWIENRTSVQDLPGHEPELAFTCIPTSLQSTVTVLCSINPQFPRPLIAFYFPIRSWTAAIRKISSCSHMP